MANAKFITKKSLIDTIRGLKVGERMRIKSKDFKFASVRTAKYVLRKEGIDINVSEKGMIDECEVIRLN